MHLDCVIQIVTNISVSSTLIQYKVQDFLAGALILSAKCPLFDYSGTGQVLYSVPPLNRPVQRQSYVDKNSRLKTTICWKPNCVNLTGKENQDVDNCGDLNFCLPLGTSHTLCPHLFYRGKLFARLGHIFYNLYTVKCYCSSIYHLDIHIDCLTLVCMASGSFH